ncbi:MAG: hypothetical protein U5K56_00150 [Halioglobus sp.]|nr:hypothetical protein [Halioglobus sp.]
MDHLHAAVLRGKLAQLVDHVLADHVSVGFQEPAHERALDASS